MYDAAMLGPILLRMILVTNFVAILATMPQFFAIFFVFTFGQVESNECYVEAALTYLGWKVTSAKMAAFWDMRRVARPSLPWWSASRGCKCIDVPSTGACKQRQRRPRS
jgi:hypothetical protein